MKKLVSFAAFVLLLSSCGAQTSNAESSSSKAESTQNDNGRVAKTISTAEFKKGVAQENIQIVDVRTPEELSEGKIDGSMNINFYDSNFKDQIAALDKATPVYVYCRSGARSSKAMQMMKEMGFKTVYELQGGFMNY
jgi:rhodanese-related sulfurtransferase